MFQDTLEQRVEIVQRHIGWEADQGQPAAWPAVVAVLLEELDGGHLIDLGPPRKMMIGCGSCFSGGQIILRCSGVSVFTLASTRPGPDLPRGVGRLFDAGFDDMADALTADALRRDADPELRFVDPTAPRTMQQEIKRIRDERRPSGPGVIIDGALVTVPGDAA